MRFLEAHDRLFQLSAVPQDDLLIRADCKDAVVRIEAVQGRALAGQPRDQLRVRLQSARVVELEGAVLGACQQRSVAVGPEISDALLMLLLQAVELVCAQVVNLHSSVCVR